MRLALLGIVLLASACGGLATSSTSDAATDALHDSPGNGDASSPTPYVGAIQLVRDSSGPTTYYGFTAYLMATPPGGAFCSSGELHGSCCVMTTTTPPAHVGAGALVLHDVTTGQSANVDWSASSNDYDAPSGPFEWSPGDEIELAAAGGVIGAFSTKAIAPAEIAGLSPNPQGNVVVSVSTDFVLAWTPAQATTMDVAVIGDSASVVCRGTDAAGSLTVPKEILASFAPSESGFIVATRSGAGVGHASNADVSFEIQTGASSPASFTP